MMSYIIVDWLMDGRLGEGWYFLSFVAHITKFLIIYYLLGTEGYGWKKGISCTNRERGRWNLNRRSISLSLDLYLWSDGSLDLI